MNLTMKTYGMYKSKSSPNVNRIEIIYESPLGIDPTVFNELATEVVNLVKSKGLSARQAQHLFAVCSENVLDITLD